MTAVCYLPQWCSAAGTPPWSETALSARRGACPAVVFTSRDAAQVWERAVREPVAPRPAVVFASQDAAQVWGRAMRRL